MIENSNETPEMMFEKGKRFYLPSQGVADPLLAIYYFTRSAEGGYVPAQRVLGTCYLEGRLAAADYEKARHWLTLAASQHDGQAAYSLALMYVLGLGVDKDWALAYKLLNMECARKLADARMLKEQLKEDLQRPFPEIEKRLEKAEKSRRGGYTSHRHRFIQPWGMVGRAQFEKEEFDVWLGLNRGKINSEDAFIELLGLMNQYYDEQEGLHAPKL